MTPPNLTELRALAEKATRYSYVDKHTTIDKWFAIYDSENRGVEICKFDYDDVDHEQVDADAAYIAATSPSMVLALLDELRQTHIDHIATLGQAAELERQLAAALAAKEEACEIADLWIHGGHSSAMNARERVAAIRSIGRSEDK